MKGNDFQQFNVDRLHAQSIPTKVSQFIVSKSDYIVVSRSQQLLFSQLSVPHIIEMEEDIFAICFPQQKAIVIVFKQKLKSPCHFYMIWIDW